MSESTKTDEALMDLIVIDVCISCYDDPFLDSRLWYSSFHRLTIREQKEESKSNVDTGIYANNHPEILNCDQTSEHFFSTNWWTHFHNWPEYMLEAKTQNLCLAL